MLTLSIWLRQIFCKHEFTFEDAEYTREYTNGVRIKIIKESRLCKKCGYHKSYDKF